jgi:hypothetical protein
MLLLFYGQHAVDDSCKDPLCTFTDNIAHIANQGSNTVSVLYGTSQQVQTGVSFNVNPFHAGRRMQ